MKPAPVYKLSESRALVGEAPPSALHLVPVAGHSASLTDLPLQRFGSRLCKRILDLAGASLLILLLLSWMVPLLGLLIKLGSKGPVFFCQTRTGKNGKPFTCFKFRTMVVNAEADVRPASARDPRITRLGSWLRSRHLDELPQLLQVWWGHMSLVGPRPYMLSDHARYENLDRQYHLRFCVKPGLTGLAQLEKPGALDASRMKARVQNDLKYLEQWSLLLDIRILAHTLRKVLHV